MLYHTSIGNRPYQYVHVQFALQLQWSHIRVQHQHAILNLIARLVDGLVRLDERGESFLVQVQRRLVSEYDTRNAFGCQHIAVVTGLGQKTRLEGDRFRGQRLNGDLLGHLERGAIVDGQLDHARLGGFVQANRDMVLGVRMDLLRSDDRVVSGEMYVVEYNCGLGYNCLRRINICMSLLNKCNFYHVYDILNRK